MAVSRLSALRLIEKSAHTNQQGLYVETYAILLVFLVVTLGKENFRILGKISQNLTVFTNFHCAGMRAQGYQESKHFRTSALRASVLQLL